MDVLAQADINWIWVGATGLLILAGTGAAVWYGWAPLRTMAMRREEQYDRVLRGRLMIDVEPRTATWMSVGAVLLLALLGLVITESILGAIILGAAGLLGPWAVIKILARRRLDKLELQLVGGIQSITSGVRAGLNLVQSMELVAREGPIPLRQEFAHLLREYEFGVPLEEAMEKAAERIGSGDFRLLFSALQTHRQRGGDLGETLDRIAESIREIQRLENRVKTLTAQGRATARAMGAMPMVVLAIIYFLRISPEYVIQLFTTPLGNLLLLIMIVLNVAGFLLIRKIMDIDI